jgi:cell filamentation protein
MTEQLGKYHVPDDEAEILPNLLGLTNRKELDLAETEGIVEAQATIIEELSNETTFDLGYIYRIHSLAFTRLYSFAGKLRTVNISKGGFMFPSAEFLENSMTLFEKEILSELPDSYTDRDTLIRDIATVHAELLFIHPFREGNGRVARILANAMAAKQGYQFLRFADLSGPRIEEYITAVQTAADKDYFRMENLIRVIF